MSDLRKKLPCTVNILGTPYRIEMRRREDDTTFEKEKICAYSSHALHLIVIGDFYSFPGITTEANEDRQAAQNNECETLRHEIIHAFLDESGLGRCTIKCKTAWSKNEETIDWFAIQAPKIFSVFMELEIMGGDTYG